MMGENGFPAKTSPGTAYHNYTHQIKLTQPTPIYTHFHPLPHPTIMSSVAGLLIKIAPSHHRHFLCSSRSLATSAQKRAAKRLAAEGKPVPPRDAIPKSPAPVKNIPKAPHMAPDAVKKTGIIDHFKAAPFIPMVVIFPTVMMGLALLIRPEWRAQVFGGKKEDKPKKAIPLDASESAKPIDEKVVLQEIQKIAALDESTQGKEATIQTSQQSTTTTEETQSQGEVRDLIYAAGFRPHPSS